MESKKANWSIIISVAIAIFSAGMAWGISVKQEEVLDSKINTVNARIDKVEASQDKLEIELKHEIESKYEFSIEEVGGARSDFEKEDIHIWNTINELKKK